MKNTEKQCAEALDAFLKSCGIKCSWQLMENDPPDFIFEVGEARWAVEATELHQYLNVHGREESRVGADKPSERMCQRIKESTNLGSNRHYVINVRGPIDPAISGTVEQRAQEYIHNGETEEQWLDIDPVDHPEPAARSALRAERESRARVSIKALLSPVKISWMIGAAGDAMAPDGEHLASNIDHQLNYALDRILNRKLPSLRALTNYDKKILTIWKGYFFAEPRAITDLLNDRDLGDIDTIVFVAEDEIAIVADPGRVLCDESECPYVRRMADLGRPER